MGLNIYQDYGLALDDEFYRRNGEFYYIYIKKLLSEESVLTSNNLELLSQTIMGNGSFVNHPVLFELILAAISDLLNITDIEKIFELSHLLNFIIFFFALIFFYKFISEKFNSRIYAIFAILTLFLSPRIFAETYYNSRDIFFLSLFIFYIYFSYQFLIKPNFKTSIYFSLTAALLIDAKILGLIPPIMFIFFYFINTLSKDKKKKTNLNYLFLVIPLIIFFIYIFWPYLWLDPLNNLYAAFKDIIQAHNELVLMNFYFGESVTSTNTPWHYRIIWFVITTPIYVLFLFFVGLTFLLTQIIKGFLKIDEHENDLWKDRNEMYDFYLFFVLITIFFITIKFNVSQFGGWRHLYFLYPIIILLGITGFHILDKLIKNLRVGSIILFLVCINILYISFWNYKYHPHQQVYFNYFSKNYAYKNFTLDNWGLSNIHSLKYILKNNTSFPIKVGTVSFSSLKVSTLILEENQRNKLIIVGNLKDADYLITNYMKKIRKNYTIDKAKYIKYFEIIVDDIPINTVYKKIK